MAYWLIKTEPETFSWDDQMRKGSAEWFGVRSYAARKHMREMHVGDLCFFYHSVKEKRVVGIARVTALAHQDSTTDDPRWECVDIEGVEPMPNPVTLEQVRNTPSLSEMVLVNNTRLSVQPVTTKEWTKICQMGGLKPDQKLKTRTGS